jgi:protein involved in polysaccharide export with SLBB domain
MRMTFFTRSALARRSPAPARRSPAQRDEDGKRNPRVPRLPGVVRRRRTKTGSGTLAAAAGGLTLLAALLLPLTGFAQVESTTNPFEKILGGGGGNSDKAAALLSREAVPVARTVEAEHYVCGAGDVLSLVITMPLNTEAVLPVSADGAVILPRIGAVQVSGMTLAEARVRVQMALQKKYSSFEGTVSLLQPRPIIVTVQGEVNTPGLLKVTAATPVSLALQMADIRQDEGQPSALQILQGGEASNNPGYRERLGMRYFGAREMDARALRRVIVRHADGTSSRADIPMYEATREAKYDPLLREGDIIIVPHREVGAPTIAALGAVQRPGVFDYMEGDKLADLVRMGFGLDPSRSVTQAELIRADGDNITLDLDQLKSIGPAKGTFLRSASVPEDITLRPGDRLMVYAVPNRAGGGSAVVDGEVLNPGTYPITPGKTTLTELVHMAGGFTAEAWPGLAELYRRQTGVDGFALDQDRERNRNFEKSNLVYEDTLYWAIGSRMREGQVSVDFHRLFVKGDGTANVTLRDGDILLVPRNTGTVYVYGQVQSSGFVPWREGMRYEDFIARAGGLGESADDERAAVIKGNTRAWIHPEDAVIEPGDMIYVPHEPLVRLSTTTDILAVAAAIVGGLAGVAGLVISVTR